MTSSLDQTTSGHDWSRLGPADPWRTGSDLEVIPRSEPKDSGLCLTKQVGFQSGLTMDALVPIGSQ